MIEANKWKTSLKLEVFFIIFNKAGHAIADALFVLPQTSFFPMYKSNEVSKKSAAIISDVE